MILTDNWYRPHPFWHRDRWRSVFMVLIINCTVAVVLAMLRPQDSNNYLLITNLCGFSMWALGSGISWLSKGKAFPWHLPLTVPIGLMTGFKLAALLGAEDIVAHIESHPEQRWQIILAISLISVASVSFSVLFVRLMSFRTAWNAEQRRAAEAHQSETAAKLALLQAQIEPHFLFNTLANVQSLIEPDPATAKSMLEYLNHYLRVSLARTRNPVATLAEELDLVQTLLAIAAIRMGPRLRYRIEVPDDARGALLPPLLLQPLVENALEHGVEPSISGGDILITGERRGDSLMLKVHDSGVGLIDASSDGVGLSNVRARLASLYGDQGRLALYANQPNGVIAELVLPFRVN